MAIWVIGIKTSGILKRFLGHDGLSVKKKYHIKDISTIAYIGRFAFEKGIETLFEAMKIVWKDHPMTQFLLAGKVDENFSETLSHCLARLSDQQKSKIINIGSFEYDEKKHIYAAVDVVVMASNMDCFGLVYLEGWACGKPVIACKDTPQETIIDHGKNGLLVEYGNPKDLAGAIEQLLKNKTLRQKMGEHGNKKFLREYNLNLYAANLKKVYEDLLAK